MMEDNEIAVFRFDASEEVHEDVDDAKRVEKRAGGDAPDLVFDVSSECIRERYVKEQRIQHKCHERVPVKAIFRVET